MLRFAFLAAAALAAVPAAAATYIAKPVAGNGEASLIARNIVWTFAGGTYRGRTKESRPLVLCQSLAKRVGRLESFAVDGKAFVEPELARCNASAHAAPAPAGIAAN